MTATRVQNVYDPAAGLAVGNSVRMVEAVRYFEKIVVIKEIDGDRAQVRNAVGSRTWTTLANLRVL